MEFLGITVMALEFEGPIKELAQGLIFLLAGLGAVGTGLTTGADLSTFTIAHGAAKAAGVVELGLPRAVNCQ